jgi:hypothetical protein
LPGIIKLIDQRQHYRQCLRIDLKFVVQCAQEADPRALHVSKKQAIFSQLSGSKRAKFCEFMPILKDFSLTWRSLDNCMLGDAQINQDKTPAG